MTTHTDITKLIQHTASSVHQLNNTKGREYATDADALANFRNRAEQMGITPLQVWGIFYGKHSDAIYSFIRTGEVLSEPIEGRIDDAILYLVLLKALVAERVAAASGIVPAVMTTGYNPDDHGCACGLTLIDPSAESKDLAGRRHRRKGTGPIPQRCLNLRNKTSEEPDGRDCQCGKVRILPGASYLTVDGWRHWLAPIDKCQRVTT